MSNASSVQQETPAEATLGSPTMATLTVLGTEKNEVPERTKEAEAADILTPAPEAFHGGVPPILHMDESGEHVVVATIPELQKAYEATNDTIFWVRLFTLFLRVGFAFPQT